MTVPSEVVDRTKRILLSFARLRLAARSLRSLAGRAAGGRGLGPMLLALALLVALPADALACPLCLAAQDESVQQAFALATLFLSVLPMAMIGGLFLWLRRRARQLAAEEAAGVIRLPVPPTRSNRAA